MAGRGSGGHGQCRASSPPATEDSPTRVYRRSVDCCCSPTLTALAAQRLRPRSSDEGDDHEVEQGATTGLGDLKAHGRRGRRWPHRSRRRPRGATPLRAGPGAFLSGSHVRKRGAYARTIRSLMLWPAYPAAGVTEGYAVGCESTDPRSVRSSGHVRVGLRIRGPRVRILPGAPPPCRLDRRRHRGGTCGPSLTACHV